jgi:3-oxoadipate enol-lactonase
VKTIRTATLNTHYCEEGIPDGAAIIFSNSLGSNMSMWRPQVDRFVSQFRIIRYDHRGHGKTEVPPGPYSFDVLCNDVVALMDALGIERAHFVGLSMGGMTALGMAIDHANRLLSITSANCVAQIAGDAVNVWDERISTVKANGLEPILDGTLERWFTAGMRETRPAEIEPVRQMIAATPVDGYIACCGALKRLNYLDKIASIDLPTLFIAGAHDVGTPAVAMQDMHRRVNGSQYVELDAAHVSNIERSEEFNQALGDFLGST